MHAICFGGIRIYNTERFGETLHYLTLGDILVEVVSYLAYQLSLGAIGYDVPFGNKAERFVYVKFWGGEKKFIYPDAFLMGFLEIE